MSLPGTKASFHRLDLPFEAPSADAKPIPVQEPGIGCIRMSSRSSLTKHTRPTGECVGKTMRPAIIYNDPGPTLRTSECLFQEAERS